MEMLSLLQKQDVNLLEELVQIVVDEIVINV